MLALQSKDVKGLFKAGNGYQPFIEKAYSAVTQHPEILPSVFNVEEFIRDYNLSNELAPIVDQINELAEGLQKTLVAVKSDALTAALDVYAAVKQNQDKVPGLKVVSDEMAVFFHRTRRKAATTAQ